MAYVTRIAPSPTGMMHVGTARTAIFNWLAARATGGQFILRIDDTDTARNQPEAVQPILDGLAWLGLDADSVHYQSQRLKIYHNFAGALLERGLAERADNGAVLLKTPASLPASWTDEIAKEIPITDRDRQIMAGLPLLRGGEHLGAPTYQFASILDDYLMGVNFIIRGVDHTPNTAKQIAIWCALNELASGGPPAPLPKFAHVGLITKDKKKLSKRDGAASLLDYREAGYLPESLFAFLVRLGWGPHVDNRENSLVTRDMALKMFLTEGNLRGSAAGMSVQLLDAIDHKMKSRARGAARAAAQENPT